MPTLALWALRDARHPERLMRSLVHWVVGLAELARAPTGRDALTTIFRYLSLVAELSAETLYTIVESQAPEAKEAVMTLAEQWLAEGAAKGEAKGRAEGEAKGRAEGEAKGRADALLAILEARRLTVTPEQRERVVACRDLATLDQWLRKAIAVNDVGQLFE